MTATDLLRELIRIPSVNPDGDPGTTCTGEKDCANFVAEFLRSCHAEARVEDVLPGRPNILGRFPYRGKAKPRLLLAPHTDTVSVAGMTIDPFSADLRDGKVWGRGATDTKGSMAAMLVALRECRDILPGLSHEIWFAGLMGEEAGQQGAKALAAKEKFDFAIVGEPTQLQIVNTHKGAVWLTLRAHGRAAHGSMPQNGENAIEKVMDTLEALRRELRVDFASQWNETLGAPTFSIGTIQGGSKINIVPDLCEARVDIRTIPGQDLSPLLDSLAKRFPGLEIGRRTSAPLWTDPAHPLVGVLESCGARFAGAPWFCDAAVLSAGGTPAVALGPGSIEQAHTADEWISVAELEAGVAFFKRLLQSLKQPVGLGIKSEFEARKIPEK
jgi:acetylornithine deacetylase/succinyl-diaminopimelate desuccinylase family protein